MSDTPTFGRYAEIPFDRMTPEQQEGYRFLVDGPRGRLPGPYKVWVHNPKLVHAAAPLGQHFTPGAVLAVGARARDRGRRHHQPSGTRPIPPPRTRSAARRWACRPPRWRRSSPGLPTSFADAREQVVYEVAMALAGGRLVPQGLYDRAVTVLGHEGVTDMIVLMGYYTCVSLTMNFYAVPAGARG